MINIYLDTSGSMTEMGKNSAMLYVAKSLQDYFYFKSIANTFYKLDGTTITDLSSIEFSNDIKINSLNTLENSILISDGLFPSEDKVMFNIAIAVGIDADLYNLEKISKKVFDNDDILSAMEYLIFHNNLLENISNDSQEDKDEW